MGHTVYNTGMCKDGDDPYLTYLNIGIQAALLLNSKAVDFVVTGCGTGQGAMMACNAFLVLFVATVLIHQMHTYSCKSIMVTH